MDDPLSWLYIVIIVLLVIFSAFCSSTETAFACLNQFKIRVKADEGNKTAKLILKTHERFDKTLIMALVGYNICSVAISTVSAVLFFKLFKNIIPDETYISLISTVVMTLIVYMFSDMVPKMIARSVPEKVARNNVYIATFVYYLLYPIIFLFSLLTKLVNKIFKTENLPTMTEEDFQCVVEDIEEKGLIEENESDIFMASLDFTDTSVKEVLTKRNKMFVIDLKEVSRKRLHEIILETRFSRIPVCYGDIDHIVGIIHVKTYIKKYMKDPNTPIKNMLQPPYFVNTKIKMDEMIDGFKKHHTHIAIVKNEGKVLGLITMEDVLEELVGKIAEPSNKGGKE